MLARAGLVTGWKIVFTKQAQKDAKKLARSHLQANAQALLDVIAINPFAPTPEYEKLTADLAGSYSRRINRQHRLVYQVYKDERVVKILTMWTHYER